MEELSNKPKQISFAMLRRLNTEHLFPRSLGHSRYRKPQNNDIFWLILPLNTENPPKLEVTIEFLSNAIIKTYLIKNLGLGFLPIKPPKKKWKPSSWR